MIKGSRKVITQEKDFLSYLKRAAHTMNAIKRGYETFKTDVNSDEEFSKTKIIASITKGIEYNLEKFNILNEKMKKYVEKVKDKLEKEKERVLHESGLGKPVYIDIRTPYIRYILGGIYGYYYEGIVDSALMEKYETYYVLKDEYNIYVIKEGCIPFASVIPKSTNITRHGYIFTFSNVVYLLLEIFKDIDYDKFLKKVFSGKEKSMKFINEKTEKYIITGVKRFEERIKTAKLKTIVKISDNDFIDKFNEIYVYMINLRNKCTEKWEEEYKIGIPFKSGLPEERMAF